MRPTPFPRQLLVIFIIVFLPTVCAIADALVITRAMKAPTIAEIFVEEEHIRVVLEVGSQDLAAFRAVLPDEVAARLSPKQIANSPMETACLSIWDKNGNELSKTVESVSIRKKIARDEITGEPKPNDEESGEKVLYAELNFQLTEPPSSLSFAPPRTKDGEATATVGFVAYHKGLPVNDFRYLSHRQTLHLDWDDPWYSQFESRNLRRQNAAPMSAFLYVEPFEVRKEIIVRPKDLQSMIGFEFDISETIPVQAQPELKERVAEFLQDKNPVTIDGETREGKLAQIHFIHRSLRRTGIIDPPEDLDSTAATLGVIYTYPIDQLPGEVTMEWELFTEDIQELPAAATDEAGPLPSVLSKASPQLRWMNYLKNPTVPKRVEIAEPPDSRTFSIRVVLSIGVYALIAVAWLTLKKQNLPSTRIRQRLVSATLFTALVCNTAYAYVAASTPVHQRHRIALADAREIIHGLLHNTYRAFDRPDPESVYDQLESGIAGELLEQVYLETLESIAVENQGGMKISVDEVEIIDLAENPPNDTGYTYDCRWRVAGSIGHWGHTHTRENTPAGKLTIAPLDGKWKIVEMNLLHESAELLVE